MTEGVQVVIYPVTDAARTKAVFQALLGVEPYADTPYYVGFKVAGQDIGLDPQGHKKGMTGPVPHFHVDDIKARLEALTGAGAEVVQDPRDVGGGRLVALAKDPDGGLIGLIQDQA